MIVEEMIENKILLLDDMVRKADSLRREGRVVCKATVFLILSIPE